MANESILGTEMKPQGEDVAIQTIIEIEKQLLKHKTEKEHLANMPRGQHPKGHGCVIADFIVADDIPTELRFGVFSSPGKAFRAWVRFSNARKSDDRLPGGHGMAIKLMGVSGDKLIDQERQTQDFVLLDHPVFFIRDAVEFAEFDADLLNSESSWSGKLETVKYFARNRDEALILIKIEATLLANPLNGTYWSVTPYKLGAGAVKYVVMPTPGSFSEPLLSIERLVERLSHDGLREAMARHLQSSDAKFDFCIQRQMNPLTEPIEDATIEWQTPALKVASIHIPKQTFDTEAQMDFCERLSFNPWHCLPEHRPLGSLNRLRKEAYIALSSFRHEWNSCASIEPLPEDSQST